MAVAILAKEGRISLDDEVKKYIPEMPEFEHPITIRHLLHHVSGLRDQWELLTTAGWRMDDVITMGHLMKIITHQRELNFEPGSRFLYSNSGYTLLAAIAVSYTHLDVYKRQTYEGWKQEEIVEWYIKCLCFSLPMRDGN